jgi:hypothetical protein
MAYPCALCKLKTWSDLRGTGTVALGPQKHSVSLIFFFLSKFILLSVVIHLAECYVESRMVNDDHFYPQLASPSLRRCMMVMVVVVVVAVVVIVMVGLAPVDKSALSGGWCCGI